MPVMLIMSRANILGIEPPHTGMCLGYFFCLRLQNKLTIIYVSATVYIPYPGTALSPALALSKAQLLSLMK